jgi:hypothetical protein
MNQENMSKALTPLASLTGASVKLEGKFVPGPN